MNINENKILWVDRYRPTTLEDYVWINESQKIQVESWINEGHIPNILLGGGPGCGKNSLVQLMMKLLNVNNGDFKYVNASQYTGIDYIRDLTNFCETMPFGKFRYVHLDESDRLSKNAQDMLKGAIEEYTDSCRWIFTTNHPNKIIPPLHSRLQGFHIESLDKEQFLSRVVNILVNEGIDLGDQSLEIIDEYITATFPDLRLCLNKLQQNCKNGILSRPSTNNNQSMTEYMVNAISLFKNGQIHAARKIICENASDNDFEEIYRLLYRNLHWFGKDEETQTKAIVIIANRLKDHTLVADPEICFAACMVELAML